MAQILERYVLHCTHRVFSIGTGLVPNEGSNGGDGEEGGGLVPRTKIHGVPWHRGRFC